MDLSDKWVSQRTVVLEQDFFSEAVADIDDNEDVAAPNERDMTKDMNTDDEYIEDEVEDQNGEEMENDWQ
ncbi:hypothetical protein AMTR_s00029p00200610 [Amborella trichopoda]|uniref:Uncharacterized protein n=1 Tax=Amborella trichopoda TaxID=13333 RepID=W1PQZ8_AMBTC|nr:hypothetical protein AMTR_s00029p00200610 [Amborella trichopoda]